MILDSERRSGSNVSLKFIIRAAAVVVPVLFILVITPLIFAARSAKHNKLIAEQEKKQLESVQNTVVNLKKELHDIQNVLNQIEGWRESRISGYQMLTGLQTIVPENVQLTRLTLDENIESVDNVSARKAKMYLKGRVIGKNAKQDVQQFDHDLKESPPFDLIMERVEVRRFAASGSAEEKDVRVFDIECIFKLREIRSQESGVRVHSTLDRRPRTIFIFSCSNCRTARRLVLRIPL